MDKKNEDVNPKEFGNEQLPNTKKDVAYFLEHVHEI